MWSFFCVLFPMSFTTYFVLMCLHLVSGLEVELLVDCSSSVNQIIAKVKSNDFQGLLIVPGYELDPQCNRQDKRNGTSRLYLAFHGCNTNEASPGFFVNKVVVQDDPMNRSEHDEAYEISCHIQPNGTWTGSSRHLGKSKYLYKSREWPRAMHSEETEAFMRVYDLENEVYVDTVKPRQLVQLQVTLRDKRKYKGRLEDCHASSSNGIVLPIIRNFCPVDLSESEVAYSSDDINMQVPFRVFPALAGCEIEFSCVVVLYNETSSKMHGCGPFRKIFSRRSKRSSDGLMKMRVSSQVQVVDKDHRTPRASGQGIVEEEILPSNSIQFPKVDAAPRSNRIPTEYLIAGASLVVGLLISVAVNIYLLFVIKRKFGPEGNEDGASVSHSVQPDVSFVSRPGRYDCLYDSSIRREPQWNQGGGGIRSSFRYGPDWDSPFNGSSRYEAQPDSYSAVKWFGKTDNREIMYPPMPIRHVQSTRRSHSFRY